VPNNVDCGAPINPRLPGRDGWSCAFPHCRAARICRRCADTLLWPGPLMLIWQTDNSRLGDRYPGGRQDEEDSRMQRTHENPELARNRQA
jgi:hypothetical protein